MLHGLLDFSCRIGGGIFPVEEVPAGSGGEDDDDGDDYFLKKRLFHSASFFYIFHYTKKKAQEKGCLSGHPFSIAYFSIADYSLHVSKRAFCCVNSIMP